MNESQQMQLAINGRVSGPAADGLRAVNESLLGSLTGGVFDNWTATGELQTALQLELNLADATVAPVVDVNAVLAKVDLTLDPGALPLTQIDGELRYTSAAGFRADNLQALLWDRELTAQIKQRALRGDDAPFSMSNSALEVALQGSVDARDLQDWLSVDALALADGVAAVDGLVSVVPGEPALLTLSSPLEGMALDLPAPWTKTGTELLPLELALPLGADRTVLGIALGDELSLHLDITGGALQSASLGLSAPPPELQPRAILAQGRAQYLDAQAWLDFTSSYLLPADREGAAAVATGLPAEVSTASGVEDFTLGITGVQAEQMLLMGREFQNVEFSLQQSSEGLTVRGSTDWLRGEYRQPAQGEASLQLDYLDAGMRDEQEMQLVEEQDDTTTAEPLVLPAIKVNVDDLRFNGKPAGSLEFGLRSADGEIHADTIQGSIFGMRLLSSSPGQLTWRQGQGSHLLLPLAFDDIGDTLEQLGYPRFLETEDGEAALDLAWPGAPEDFGLAKLEGGVRLDLGAGRFLETPGGAGALRVVEIVNLASIVQRLSLSHMFDGGLSFETMDGEIFFHSGTLEVANLSVRSSASAFAMSGVSDIATRSLDGELVATLPVANNLPWVAAIAAGPAVAAGVFVVGKVFEKQMNRLYSGVYSIKGTWDEPQLNFDRIFDDEVRLEPAAGADSAPPGEPPEDPAEAQKSQAAASVEAAQPSP
jgi:uncharacterized protein YhdP